MMVNDQQLAHIKGFLLEEGVTNVPLQEDLVDHFCCVIEERLEDGITFEQAFGEARGRISPNGAKEIENDLDYLLTIKTKIMLRKIVFGFGFLAVFQVMMGVALGLPGIIDTELSRLIIMSGIILCMISVLPYIFYLLYKRSVNKLQES